MLRHPAHRARHAGLGRRAAVCPTFDEAARLPFLFQRQFSLPLPHDPKVDLLRRELLEDEDAVRCLVDGAGLFDDSRDHLLYDIRDHVDTEEQRQRLTTQALELHDEGEISGEVARLIVNDLAPVDDSEGSFFLEACRVATLLASPTGRPRLPWLADELDAHALRR